MEEFFKSLREDVERARALWIINNMDLIEGYAKVKYIVVAYYAALIKRRSDEMLTELMSIGY